MAVRAAREFSEKSKETLIGDVDIFKVNVGYDFGSWWVGHEWVKRHNREKIYTLDSLCICNDSFFGNVSVAGIEKMHLSDADISGVSDSYDHCHHIQSFFIVIKGQYLKSGEFYRSLSSYKFPSVKSEVVRLGELLLSRNATESRVKISSYKCYANLLGD